MMKDWNKQPVKKSISKQQLDDFCTPHIKNKINSLFGTELAPEERAVLSQIFSTILIRRNIPKEDDILYYLEDDMRFQHSPFLFSTMEDAVERIIQAKEEEEKVLIFGDKDVDGVTSTVILYSCLKKMGLDVQWRVPLDNDSYGLSIQAIDDFANEGGSLIITVDCGISNFDEIHYAADKYIDVIVTDHHNAPESLPDAVVIVDPKTEDSGYPFQDISGAAVAYKLVSALRFSNSDFYNAELCILDISKNENGAYSIDCLKIKNLTKLKELHESVIPGKTSFYDLKLPYFLQGQMIYSWDCDNTKKLLRELFGSGIDFYLFDLRAEIAKLIPSFSTKSIEDIKNQSLIAKYHPEENTTINCLFNLYVTYTNMMIAKKFPDNALEERKDLQLVALAAIADIMPLKNENRLFVRAGINSLSSDGPRKGLLELFSRLRINTEILTAKDLSWTVTPALNAAGRLGQADVAIKLLLAEEAPAREEKADEIVRLNDERKEKLLEISYKTQNSAKESIVEYQNKLCVVYNEEIDKGLTGNLANRFMQDFGVPSIVFTKCNDIYVGSMRSNRGLIATDFLDSFGDFFINHGGHNFAAGFSFESNKYDTFIQKIKDFCAKTELEPESKEIMIDAEIPQQYLSPSTFKITYNLEPFGCQNSDLIFKTTKVKVVEAVKVGKKDPCSLKLLLDCGKYKFPALYWGMGDLLNTEINIGEYYDILYNMSRNYFNGNITQQFEIIDIRKSI